MLKFLLIVIIMLSSYLTHAQYDKLFQVAHLYPKGLYEVHIFNNLWTRKSKTNGASYYNQRESFFTSWGQFTYGYSERVNIGIDVRLRSVIKTEGSEGNTFDALKFKNTGNFNQDEVSGYSRVDVTSIGLRVKYKPIKSISNFSMEHILFLPVKDDLEGNDDTGFADWQGGVIWNRFFIEQMIGSKFLLFTQLNLLFEDVAVPFLDNEDAYYQYGFPITVIGTYIINPKTFIYGLLEIAPLWGTNTFASGKNPEIEYSPYSQIGIGGKYFFKPWLQSEIIITRFHDTTINAQAWTYNLGIRFFGLTRKAKEKYEREF